MSLTQGGNHLSSISPKLQENIEFLEKEMGIGASFDVVMREMHLAGTDMAILFIDGFAKDQVMLLILNQLARLERRDIAISPVKRLMEQQIPYIEVTKVDKLHAVVDAVLPGAIALLIDGEAEAIIIDAREYPVRGPEEPDIERVTRGSRDGFVETIVFNTALLRRRIRDPKLRMEMLHAGVRSKTDIALCYLEDVANPSLVRDLRKRIERIKVDGLPMADKSLEEFFTGGKFTLFPRVRYTERPDVAAVHILEGHVIIMVDTSPSVIIAPATWFHHVQHAEEYRSTPLVGAYIRWVRFLAILLSVIATPIWLAAANNPEILPAALRFIGPKEVGNIPLWGQLLLAEFGLDAIRMAAIHTPSPLFTALGIIAAFTVGDVAIKVGLFTPEVILYMAIAAVGSFATPSFELANAHRLVRLGLLIAVTLFGVPGLIGGILLTLLILAGTKSFGVPYLWPLIPFNWKALRTILIRRPVPLTLRRPSALKPQDSDRTR